MRSDFKFYIIVALFVFSIAANFCFSVIKQGRDDQSTSSNGGFFFGKGLKLSTNLGGAQGGDGILKLDINGIINFQESGAFDSPYTARPRVTSWISVLDKARKDPKIKGLLLRVDSGGGSVVASQELYKAIKRFGQAGKKIVVSVGQVCASGAYMISLPADVIVVNEGSVVGSIGVLMQKSDVSELMKKIGVKPSIIKSVKHKDILSPFRPATEKEEKILQNLVAQIHETFVRDVVEWRAKHSSEKKIRDLASGLFWIGAEAKNHGLVDKIGDGLFAKKEIASLTGMDHETMKIYGVNDYLQGSFFDQLTNISLSLFHTWVKDGIIVKSLTSVFDKMFTQQHQDSLSY